MNAQRVVFMGTPEFAVPSLEALLSVGYNIVAVYTQPDRPAGRGRALTASPVKKLAESKGIENVQPLKLRDPSDIQKLASLAPDVVVVSAYGQILPQAVLDIPRYGCINIHPSLLPRWRGASPIPWAILEGDEATGVTIMLMDAGMDTGPILNQAHEHILPDDTAATLSERLAKLGSALLVETLPMWLNGEIRPYPQDNSRATYSRTITKEDGEMGWERPAAELWRRVRAFQPWPTCYTWYQGKMLKVLDCMALPDRPGCVPGRVVPISPEETNDAEVGVETGEGVLGLRRVQPEGKREMWASDFARGARGFVGSVLPLR
ncbi:MAG: methionyl-tRNA formyltransferase [Chloroflexi bacterium]|nr:methionyl-tRNA formyltransferase [Chloroflexota bacterium]